MECQNGKWETVKQQTAVQKRKDIFSRRSRLSTDEGRTNHTIFFVHEGFYLSNLWPFLAGKRLDWRRTTLVFKLGLESLVEQLKTSANVNLVAKKVDHLRIVG